MARKFRGEGIHKVDSKGRVSIPAAFRRVLEEGDPDWTDGLNPNLVIVYGDARRNYLEGFSMVTMDEVDEKIAAHPRGSRARQMLEKLYSGQSTQIQTDETGRLVLSTKLRNKIGITNEAFFIASGDTFQIWEPSTYEAENAKQEEWYDDYDEDFDASTLLDAIPLG